MTDPQKDVDDEGRALAARILLSYLDDPDTVYGITDTLDNMQAGHAICGLASLAAVFGENFLELAGQSATDLPAMIIKWVDANNQPWSDPE